MLKYLQKEFDSPNMLRLFSYFLIFFMIKAFYFIQKECLLFLCFFRFCLFLGSVLCVYKGLLVLRFLDQDARFPTSFGSCLINLVLMKNYCDLFLL